MSEPILWHVIRGSYTVATVASLEAADAVERLYRNAWAAGERPTSSLNTVVAERVDDYPYHAPEAPLDEEAYWRQCFAGMDAGARRGYAWAASAEGQERQRTATAIAAESRNLARWGHT